jgi:uncharacterized protein (DUF1499 family)
MKLLLVLLILGLGAPVLAGQLGWFSGSAPTDLGVRDARLKPPSSTRNSVSSQAHLYPDHPQRDYAQMAPLPLRNADPQASLGALVQTLQAMPGVTIVQHDGPYVYATARTRWLGFVDDLEFWLDPTEQVIHLRSASRLGREDFGVNRQRIQAIRQAYEALQ